MHQVKPLIDITLQMTPKWVMAREMLCSQLGLIGNPAPMEWKKHDTDYNYSYGLWTSSHRAIALIFQLFLFIHLVTILALGT